MTLRARPLPPNDAAPHPGTAKARAIRLGDTCAKRDPNPSAYFASWACTRPLYHAGRHYFEDVDRILAAADRAAR